MFEILEEVVHAFNPNTWEAAADRSLNLKLAWPIAFQDSQGYKEKKKFCFFLSAGTCMWRSENSFPDWVVFHLAEVVSLYNILQARMAYRILMILWSLAVLVIL